MVGRKGDNKGFLTKTLDSLVSKIPLRYRRTLTNTVAGLGLVAAGFLGGKAVYEPKQEYSVRPVAESTAASFDTPSVRLYSPDTSSWRNTPGTDPTPNVYTVVLKRGDTVSEVVEKVRAEHPELRVGSLYGDSGQVNTVARASAEIQGQANLLEDVVSAGGVRKQDGIIGDNAKEGQTLVFTRPHTVVSATSPAGALPMSITPLSTQATGQRTPVLSHTELARTHTLIDSTTLKPDVLSNVSATPYAFAESILGMRSLPEQQSQNLEYTRPGTALVVRDSYLPQRHGEVTADAMEAFMPQYSASKSVVAQILSNDSLETTVRAAESARTPSSISPMSDSSKMPYGLLVLGAAAGAVIGSYLVKKPKDSVERLRENIKAGKKKREQTARENAPSEPAAEPQPETASETPESEASADDARPEPTPELSSYVVSSTMPAWKVTLTKRYSTQGAAELERVIKEYVALQNANLETGNSFYDLYRITPVLRQELAKDAEEFKTETIESRAKETSLEDALRKAYRVAAQPEARRSNSLAALSLVVRRETPAFPYVDKKTIENNADLFIRRLYDKPLDYKMPQSTDVSRLIDELRERESASAPTP